MTKLHDLIKHLQEYEEKFGNMPVYLSSETMNKEADVNIRPVCSSNVAEVSDVIDPVTKKMKIAYHIVILADYILIENGYPMSTEEDKNE
jgi:hypothetical protein